MFHDIWIHLVGTSHGHCWVMAIAAKARSRWALFRRKAPSREAAERRQVWAPQGRPTGEFAMGPGTWRFSYEIWVCVGTSNLYGLWRFTIPTCSMYSKFTNIWVIYEVNVGKHSHTFSIWYIHDGEWTYCIISLLFATGKESHRLGPPLESVKREHVPWPCLLQESFVSRTELGMGSRWLLIEKHMLIWSYVFCEKKNGGR